MTETVAGETGKTPKKPRTDIRVVESWEDVDTALGVLRLADAKQATVAASFDARIQMIQEEKQKALQALIDRTERVGALVEAFVTRRRVDLAGKSATKSRKLVHGIVGFRTGAPKLVFLTSEAATLKLLRARGHTECLVVTESIDKAKVKELPQAERALCGVCVDQEERFFYKLNVDAPVEYPEVDDGEPS